MAGLKNFTGAADRPNISAPWLTIKGGHLFLCATNGHLAVAIELTEYHDQTKDQDDDFAYLPPEVFAKPKTATLTGSRWSPEVEDVTGHTGQPPDVFAVIPKERATYPLGVGKAPIQWGANATYLKDIAELFERVFKSQKMKTITFHMGDDYLSPILMTGETPNRELIVNCVLMPVRIDREV